MNSPSPEESTSAAEGASRATLPGFILYHPEQSRQSVAGLTLVDRQIVAMHAAGLAPITLVATGPVTAPARAAALQIPFQLSASIPGESQPGIVLDANVFIDRVDLQQLAEKEGSLTTKEGERIPAVHLAQTGNWERNWDLPQEGIQVKGHSATVPDAKTAKRLERRLLQTTSNTSDGLVDRLLNRPLSRFLTRRLLPTPVSPQFISLASIAIGILAALCLAIPRYEFAVIGSLLFQLSAIVDCSDGDIARLRCQESLIGRWLDIVGDQIVHIAIFVGIGMGLIQANPSVAITILTGSAVVGAILSFGTVIWAGNRTQGNPKVHRLIQATATRDFSIVVLLLACLGRLDVFAWLVGIGIHVYWIGILALTHYQAKPIPRP